jgi:hypothetical protein
MLFVLRKEDTHNEIGPFALDPSEDSQSPKGIPTPYVIASSNEERLTITYLLQTYILEPISTLIRFLRLALLFGPVILTSPMLLIGSSNSGRAGHGGVAPEEIERWGAVWWYGFLVAQMERAGPTFIKVSLYPMRAVSTGLIILHSSWDNGQPLGQTFSQLLCVSKWANYIPTGIRIPFNIHGG